MEALKMSTLVGKRVGIRLDDRNIIQGVVLSYRKDKFEIRLIGESKKSIVFKSGWPFFERKEENIIWVDKAQLVSTK